MFVRVPLAVAAGSSTDSVSRLWEVRVGGDDSVPQGTPGDIWRRFLVFTAWGGGRAGGDSGNCWVETRDAAADTAGHGTAPMARHNGAKCQERQG